MKAQEIQAFAREIAPVIAGFVGAAVAPLQQRLAEAEEREKKSELLFGTLMSRIEELERRDPAPALVASCHEIVKREVTSLGEILTDLQMTDDALGQRLNVLESREVPEPLKGEPGANATDEQVAIAVANYFSKHPPQPGKNGENATPEQIRLAVENYIAANPPKNGEPGANATDSQVETAVAAFLRAHPPAKGDGPSELEIEGAVARHLRANPPQPGAPGANATEEQVERAVSTFIRLNPPKPGDSPTPQQIAEAASAYLREHPPLPGKAGENATDEQVAKAVAAHFSANQSLYKGEPGKSASLDQIAVAVADYMAAHPVEPGKPGENASEAQIAKAVAEHLEKHPPRQGDPGEPGKNADPVTASALFESVRKYMAENPPPAGKNAQPEEIAAAVAAYMAQHPVKDGSTPSDVDVYAAVSKHMEKLNLKGDPGENATTEQIAEAVEKYFAENPPRQGDPGEPGKNAEPVSRDQIAAEVAEYLKAHPPKDGVSVRGEQGRGVVDVLQDAEGAFVFTFTDGVTKNVGPIRQAPVAVAVADDGLSARVEKLEDNVETIFISARTDGEKIHQRISDIEKRIVLVDVAAEFEKAIGAAAPTIVADAVAKAGEHLKVPTFLISQEGNLVVVNGDGAKSLGRVVGRDGTPAPIIAKATIEGDDGILVLELSDGTKFRPGRVVGERGTDGFGFEHMSVITEDGGRTVIYRFTRGDETKDVQIVTAHVLDAGIYTKGATYKKGDSVSYDGSMFIAQKDTSAEPTMSKDWRLAIKRGRDGRVEERMVAEAVAKYMKDHPPKQAKENNSTEYRPFSSK